MSLINIIKSRFKKETGDKLTEEKRNICKTCPLNTINLPERSFKIKAIKVLSDLLTWITRTETKDIGYCSSCGCPLWEKTKMEDEKCPLNKWKI